MIRDSLEIAAPSGAQTVRQLSDAELETLLDLANDVRIERGRRHAERGTPVADVDSDEFRRTWYTRSMACRTLGDVVEMAKRMRDLYQTDQALTRAVAAYVGLAIVRQYHYQTLDRDDVTEALKMALEVHRRMAPDFMRAQRVASLLAGDQEK